MLKWKLAACRVNAELTQTEAAEQMHISPATLIAHEKGKIKPTLAQLELYAKIYKVPVGIIDVECR